MSTTRAAAELSFLQPTAGLLPISIPGIASIILGTIIHALSQPSRMSLIKKGLRCCRATCRFLQDNLPRGFANLREVDCPRCSLAVQVARVLKPPSNSLAPTPDALAFWARRAAFMG